MTSRLPLAHLPTPVEPLDRLSEWLGGPRILVKRDDLTGLALGGNKARKLEFLCAEALERGCDTLVTGGGAQSNHARMTAAAANRLGLECHIALAGAPSVAPTGNVLLGRLLGAHLHFAGERGYYAVEAAIMELAERLAAEGRRPYAIPIGGASVTGALAYVEAAEELLGQLPGVDWVVVADGSGGTHAGLLTGLGGHTRVLGIDVGTRPDLDESVPELAAGAAAAAGRKPPEAHVIIDHSRFGPGYGKPTPESLEAIRAAAPGGPDPRPGLYRQSDGGAHRLGPGGALRPERDGRFLAHGRHPRPFCRGLRQLAYRRMTEGGETPRLRLAGPSWLRGRRSPTR